MCVAATCAAPSSSYGFVRSDKVSYDTPVVRISTTTAAPYIEKHSYGYDEPKLKIHKMIPILRYILKDDNYGKYHLETASADGSLLEQEGHLKDLGDAEGPVQVTSGSFSFIGDDGKTYTVRFTADENGFQATGDHLPTPPPIPEEIRKSLIEALSDSTDDGDDGSYHEDLPSVPQKKLFYNAPDPVIKISSSSVPITKFSSTAAPLVASIGKHSSARFPVTRVQISEH